MADVADLIFYIVVKVELEINKQGWCKHLKDITFSKAQESDLKEKMLILIVIPRWEQCLNMVVKEQEFNKTLC